MTTTLDRPARPAGPHDSAPAVAPLRLAEGVVADPPVVLAPMAGITNTAFRVLCREQGAALPPAGVRRDPAAGGALYVSEMITSRALVEGNPKTMQLIEFDPVETPRSLQLYAVDPAVVAAAVRIVVERDLADHVDLNFGCPVPKVTRRGGGSALPWRIDLFSDVVSAAVRATGGRVPVTVKMRMGIDPEHLTYREAGERAQEAGVAAVTLHGRTASQFYSGHAHWDAIADLVDRLDVPVLGNGDIWEADDALRMLAETHAAGVVIGRGCLGRPWLFADLAAAFAGSSWRARPTLGDVAATMRRHAELLSAWAGEERGCTEFRKHIAWYLKGFPAGGELRKALAQIASLAELDALLARLDHTAPYPESVIGQPRGRVSTERAVTLPEGWLADRHDRTVPFGAETDHSGG